ncbi:MAG TPA: hypothetical protein VNX21_05865 [Candidatus Thermoplasmatota archaeon]|nr:hypothetical protein [Candidatus Thermoplasmatota archaeon]
MSAVAPPVAPPVASSAAGVQGTAGGLSLLEGEPAVLGIAEGQVLLSTVERGFDALLVSGDNRLDAYGLLAHARARGVEDALADGLVVARAFTVHQLAALVEETLPRMARERPRAGVAVVAGLLEPFRDEDVRPAEARTLLRRVLRSLSAWSEAAGVPAVATLTPGPYLDVARDARLPVRRVAPAPRSAWTLDRFAAAEAG